MSGWMPASVHRSCRAISEQVGDRGWYGQHRREPNPPRDLSAQLACPRRNWLPSIAPSANIAAKSSRRACNAAPLRGSAPCRSSYRQPAADEHRSGPQVRHRISNVHRAGLDGATWDVDRHTSSVYAAVRDTSRTSGHRTCRTGTPEPGRARTPDGFTRRIRQDNDQTDGVLIDQRSQSPGPTTCRWCADPRATDSSAAPQLQVRHLLPRVVVTPRRFQSIAMPATIPASTSSAA